MEKIPKIIHYCWVGGNPKPESVLYCIESWKKYCPEYEIKEWNESNYDFTQNLYMNQAYEAKKWGFVPDYARLDIVYNYGGIYLDTDVEMVRNFDKLLENQAFMGFENTGDGEYFVNCGHGFGAVPHHPIIKQARDLYDHLSFIKENGELNLIPSPYYTTQTLRQFGLKQKNETQQLENMIIFRSDVLCPKNFRTGKLKVTENTFSIHHFTASWLDDKIKDELQKRQSLEKRFGIKATSRILYMQSVLEKYSGKKFITELPKRFLHKLKLQLIKWMEICLEVKKLFVEQFKTCGNEGNVLLDTSLGSDNAGDKIIVENCIKNFPADIKEWKKVGTHELPKADEKKILKNSDFKLLCGTNILSGHMNRYGLWRMDPEYSLYQGTVLMGVGFDSEGGEVNYFSKKLLKLILHKKYLHSVRDSFAEQKLQDMGIHNVINTGCPTMWGLNPEFCASIPQGKGKYVICTITDYCQDKENDKKMVEVLIENYEKVYLWIQGRKDLKYAQELGIENKVEIVPQSLEEYDKILEMEDLDYVGTRLHAGIRALAAGHRSIIVQIDNRAKAIAKDTNLPIIKRDDIKAYLLPMIHSDIKTEIHLPFDAIEKWKRQFK